MKKPLILFMFGVAVFFILKNYYAQGNSGMPNPNALSPPFYLYGILALTADFAGGLPIVLGVGLTFALIWQSQNKQGQGQKGTAKPATSAQTTKQTVASG